MLSFSLLLFSSSSVCCVGRGESGGIDDDELLLLFENMKTYFSRYPNRKVVDICKEYDNAYQQELGKSLYDIRLMCAARLITFDIRYPFHILTAKDITFRSMSLSERRTYVAS